jgi:hypothetical protein
MKKKRASIKIEQLNYSIAIKALGKFLREESNASMLTTNTKRYEI